MALAIAIDFTIQLFNREVDTPIKWPFVFTGWQGWVEVVASAVCNMIAQNCMTVAN